MAETVMPVGARCVACDQRFDAEGDRDTYHEALLEHVRDLAAANARADAAEHECQTPELLRELALTRDAFATERAETARLDKSLATANELLGNILTTWHGAPDGDDEWMSEFALAIRHHLAAQPAPAKEEP